jgi:predicted nucleotidyltransferase
MTLPKDIRTRDELDKYCILHVYRGSIAHGMYVPNTDPMSFDDKDTMAVSVFPKEYYLGLRVFGSRGTREIKQNEWDIVVYEIKKAVSLLANGNPNVLSMLWVSDEYIIKQTGAGSLLRTHRSLFSGKHVYRSFTGYAYSQLHKMTNCKFEGYMGEKRKQLVQKFGYDTKNAAHLIRLLRMGIEFLTDGALYIKREDASQLLEIKHGAWTLEQVKKEADRLFASAEDAYIHSALPKGVDYEKINRLCVDIVETAWKEQNDRT